MKEIFLVLDIDYALVGNRGVIKLFCKDEDGRNVLVLDHNFDPYFYVMPKKGKTLQLKRKIENLKKELFGVEKLKCKIVKKIWNGEEVELIKIIISNPRKIQKVRDGIKNWKEVKETYEYDIPFCRRYLIDKQIIPIRWIEVEVGGERIENEYKVKRVIKAHSLKPINIKKDLKFKILAFDTEFIEENGKQMLIMLSIADNRGFNKILTTYSWKKAPDYVESVENEKRMIERFVEIVNKRDPDFICTYNGDIFDFPRLKEKADEFKIKLSLGRDDQPIRIVRRGRISSIKIKGRVHIDLFNFVDHILSPTLKSEVLTLDEVAQELLGIGKKEMKYKEMVEIWSKKEGIKRLVEYSMWDSKLTLKLAEHILPQIFALCEITGLVPFDVCRNTYSQLVEAFYMRKAVKNNVLIPNRPKKEEIEKRRLVPAYKGAIVIEPKKGIHRNILVFDFRSLYPTILVVHNISPETLNCEHRKCKEKNKVPETKWHFCTIKKGFIPVHLEELIKRRQEIKKQMRLLKKGTEEWKKLNNIQYALKIIANASYGYFGFFGARWYKRECGASAAAWGRFYIKKIIELAKKESFEIIYGDTDSLFVTPKVNYG